MAWAKISNFIFYGVLGAFQFEKIGLIVIMSTVSAVSTVYQAVLFSSNKPAHTQDRPALSF